MLCGYYGADPHYAENVQVMVSEEFIQHVKAKCGGLVFYCYEDSSVRLGGHCEPSCNDKGYTFYTNRYVLFLIKEHGSIVARWIVKRETP